MAISPALLQRSRGSLAISFKAFGDKTQLDDLYQSGCLKARLPRHRKRAAEAILINTSGGLTDGDELRVRATFGEQTCAVLSSQAAERIYRSRDSSAVVNTTLTVGECALAAWLPQETIVFDGGRLSRSNRVSMTSSSRFVGVESVILGRGAMGETVHDGLLEERWELRMDGAIEFVDATRIGSSGIEKERMRRALLGGANCFATVLIAGDALLDLLDPLRACIERSGVVAGATAPGRFIVARLLSEDPALLRETLVDVLALIADKEPAIHLPKVWTL